MEEKIENEFKVIQKTYIFIIQIKKFHVFLFFFETFYITGINDSVENFFVNGQEY